MMTFLTIFRSYLKVMHASSSNVTKNSFGIEHIFHAISLSPKYANRNTRHTKFTNFTRSCRMVDSISMQSTDCSDKKLSENLGQIKINTI